MSIIVKRFDFNNAETQETEPIGYYQVIETRARVPSDKRPGLTYWQTTYTGVCRHCGERVAIEKDGAFAHLTCTCTPKIDIDVYSGHAVDTGFIGVRTNSRNEVPPNWKPLTEAEFATSAFFRESLHGIEYRQFKAPGDSQMRGWRVFYSDLNKTEGFAIGDDYWGKKVLYGRFATCVHEWRAPTPDEYRHNPGWSGRCISTSVCDKCGVVSIIDSSD